MKIALVCPYNMFERAGGVHQVVIHLYEGLKKNGYDVKIITPRPTTYKGEAPTDYILLGTSRNFKGGFGTAGNWTMPPDGDDIQAVFKREKFDVINFHEPWAPIMAWQMLKHSKAAHVGTFHANLIDNATVKSWVNVFMPYGRGIGQKMHLFTAVSPAPASLLVDRAENGLEKKLVENIKYIPNGIDLKLYHPPKKRLPLNGPSTKTIVYVGRLDRRKGINYLIRAFAIVSAEMPNAYLIIAGEGSQRNRLEQLVKSLAVKNIHFTGYVSDAEKRRLMGNADVFCSPALFGESFGIVLIEAMAMGAPVIAGQNSGYINVLVGSGRIGLIDPKALTDFANRLRVFMTDDKINQLLRGWGLKEVKKYDYPKIIRQYEAAYKEALKILNQDKAATELSKENAKSRKKLVRRLFTRRQAG